MGKARSAALFGVVLLAWALIVPRMHVETSIAHFLPDTQDKRIGRVLRLLGESELAAVTTIDLSGADEETLVLSAKAMMEGLKALPTTKGVRSASFDAESLRAFVSRYPPSAFLSQAMLDDRAIDVRIAALKDELGGPFGALIRLSAPRDPLGGGLALARMADDGGPIANDGVLVTRDGQHAFVLVTTNGSAFDANVQRRSLDGIDRIFQSVKHPGMKLEISGVSRYAVSSEEHIRGDIQRIGILSTLGVLLLFGLVFRSLRMLLLGLVPLLFGSMVATLGSALLFSSVHGLTLVFGTSLLGVGIDYAEHYYSHFALEPETAAAETMRRIWPGLVMGALTTIVGLAGLAWADFPGAIQMAVFATLAVLGALVGTRWLLPPWMPARYKRPIVLARIESSLFAILEKKNPLWRWAPIVVLALLAVGLVRTKTSNDMAALMSVDPQIASEDERVRTRITRSDPGRFAIVIGKDEEAALEDLARVQVELSSAKESGALDHFLPLGLFLRSERQQRETRALAIEKQGVVRAALIREGFRVEAFLPWEEALQKADVATLADWFDSPIGAVIRPLAPKMDGQQVFIIPLGGVRSIADLRTRVPHALILDEGTLLSDTYGHVRTRVMTILALGLPLVFLILMARYRRVTLALSAMVPAVVAALAVPACFGWMHAPLDIFHAIGLALVLSMGTDYGIFVVEARASPELAARSLVSILVATTTTALSFGMLATSSSPALRSLGITVMLGIIFALVFSPMALRRT